MPLFSKMWEWQIMSVFWKSCTFPLKTTWDMIYYYFWYMFISNHSRLLWSLYSYFALTSFESIILQASIILVNSHYKTGQSTPRFLAKGNVKNICPHKNLCINISSYICSSPTLQSTEIVIKWWKLHQKPDL